MTNTIFVKKEWKVERTDKDGISYVQFDKDFFKSIDKSEQQVIISWLKALISEFKIQSLEYKKLIEQSSIEKINDLTQLRKNFIILQKHYRKELILLLKIYKISIEP